MSEYVNCKSKFNSWQCRKRNSICENFLNKVTSLKKFEKVECGVYAFAEEGLIKYEAGKVTNLSIEEVRRLEMI